MAKQGMNTYKGRAIPKSAIEGAINKTMSMRAAAMEMNVSYNTFKKYCKLYDMWNTNQSGVGISKGWAKRGAHIDDILAGKHPNLPHYRLQEKLLKEAILKQECYNCGYDEYRRTDMSSPLVIDFMDGDGTNHSVDNLRMLCFNCFYILKDIAKTVTIPKNVTRLRKNISAIWENNEEKT